MNTKLMYEILEEVEQRDNEEDRVAVLRCNANKTLKTLLQYTFDPNIKFDVTVPEYRVSQAPVGLGYNSIHEELGRVYLFQENHPRRPPNLSDKRKTEILTQMLEAMEAKEADIFASMILKKSKYTKLTYDVVKEAFPELLP
jgi:hypothetical protein